MEKPLKIVIVGGGTAGWMVASFLKKFHSHHSITLIESDKIKPIGVGESVTPHVTAFFNSLGIPEHEWMKATNSVYKLANRFVNWVHNKDEYQYFGFSYPQDSDNLYLDNSDILDWKEQGAEINTTDCVLDLLRYKFHRFDRCFDSKFHYMERNVAPFHNQKLIPNLPGSKSNHINAELVGPFLRDNFALNKDVKHIVGDVVKVSVLPHGVSHLVMENGDLIDGDLFVDCTGFANIILRNFDIGYKDYYYPITGAVVGQTDYVDQSSEMVNYSQSIAEDFGWRFRIGLWDRLGNGYCFNHDLYTAEKASDILQQKVGKTRVDPRHIQWKPRRLKEFGKQNVVSVGLGSGFIEPLEANGLFIVTACIESLSEVLKKHNGSFDWSSMNDRMATAIDDVYDFLIVHYTLTKRQDTEFWKEMALYGKQHHHKELMFEKYNSHANTMYSALKFNTLYPDYMWAQMAHYYELDVSKWKKQVNQTTMKLAELYFEYKDSKHKLVSQTCMNNYEWHKKFIFQG